MRSAFFWDITQRKMVILTDVLEQLIGVIFKGQESLEDVADVLSRNLGK